MDKPVHPRVCGHQGNMVYDDDFCCCKKCEQSWVLKEGRGFVPIVNGKLFFSKSPYKRKY